MPYSSITRVYLNTVNLMQHVISVHTTTEIADSVCYWGYISHRESYPEKSFLLYFLRKCSSFTKEMNIKWFFVITEIPFLVSSPLKVDCIHL